MENESRVNTMNQGKARLSSNEVSTIKIQIKECRQVQKERGASPNTSTIW